MRRILPFLLSLLLFSAPIVAQRSIAGIAATSVFTVVHTENDGPYTGTGFCVPGHSQFVLTASHMIGDDLKVYSQNGHPHAIKAVMRNDPRTDVAVIMLEDVPCEFSSIEFAKESGPVGKELWLIGYGGALLKPLLTHGIMASEAGIFPHAMNDRAAQLNALSGHSGGPVFNSMNQVVGMLVGTYQAVDQMDVIVPVEVLRKAIK